MKSINILQSIIPKYFASAIDERTDRMRSEVFIIEELFINEFIT